MSFVSFLQEKKSSSLPFLSRKKRKQKKVICGAVALRCCCLFRQRATQNGRFIWKPSVFSFRAGHAGNRLFSERKPPPQCLLFLFFKKRNRPPFLFFLKGKGSKRKSSAEQFSPLLLPFSPTCYTKRTVHMETVRFFVPSRTCGKPPFLRKKTSPAVSFVSFLQEKKSSSLRRKEIVPLRNRTPIRPRCSQCS